MKVFEIGNGQTIIKGPSHYYSCSDGDSTVILYKSINEDEPLIRFSMLYFKRAEGVSEKEALSNFKAKAEEHNTLCVTHNGKTYFSYDNVTDHGTYMRVFEVMYDENIVIASVTADVSDKESEEVKNQVGDVIEMIKSIDSLSSLKFPLLEPRYEDMEYLVTDVMNVLGIQGEQINEYHESGQSVAILQDILTRRDYEAYDYRYHSSLGVLFGDCLQHAYSDFHWVIVHDQYGRELALQYQDYAVQCFPISMITKRIEDGIEINVAQLIGDTVHQLLSGLEKEGGYSRLEYNY